jgi:hypothetical protein
VYVGEELNRSRVFDGGARERAGGGGREIGPCAAGLVRDGASLARPGGNITGVFFHRLELTGKRLEIFGEAVPKVRRVAVLWDVFSAAQLKAAETAAREHLELFDTYQRQVAACDAAIEAHVHTL